MNTYNLTSLKSLETTPIAKVVSSRLFKNDPSVHITHSSAIAVAYASLITYEDCLSEDEVVQYLRKKNMDYEIQEFIIQNIQNCLPLIQELKDKFSKDQLVAFILFDTNFEDPHISPVSTPVSVSKLAARLLNLNSEDCVLEMCSGKGSFALECFALNEDIKYTGLEINVELNFIAQIRASLLNVKAEQLAADCFLNGHRKKYDKVFANYPFMVRTPYIERFKSVYTDLFKMREGTLQKASSDWIFNSAIVANLNKSGKGAAIMSMGSTWNSLDSEARKFFIENGYIEAVITLPQKLFIETNIPTVLIVFSHNNKSIRMVDASNIYTAANKINELSEENIENILKLLSIDSDISASIDIAEFENNEYSLNATRFFEKIPEIENGVAFESIVKNITRGSQLKAKDLEDLKSESETIYQYLMLANINDGVIDIPENQFLSSLPKRLDKYCAPNNALVLSKIAAPSFRSAIVEVKEGHFLLAQGNLFIIEIDTSKANPYFVQAFFASEVGEQMFKSIYTGGVLPTISIDKLKQLIVPLPPLEEQNKIAEKYAAAVHELAQLRKTETNLTSEMKHIFTVQN